MKARAIAFAILALLLFAGVEQASAQQEEAVRELVVAAQNITASNETAAGRARPENVAVPGDVIEYRLVFTNTRDFEMKNVAFQDPIPGGLSYLPMTARSSREDVIVEYSIDSGKTWSERPMAEVVVEGKKVTRPAPPEMYTNVRWRVTGMVAPGASVEAQFRARVSAPAAAPRK